MRIMIFLQGGSNPKPKKKKEEREGFLAPWENFKSGLSKLFPRFSAGC